MNARRNPVLDLPSARALEELPIEARIALRAVLLDLADEANDQAEDAWSRKKGPMAAYWRAVSTYAKHIARATLLRSEASPAVERLYSSDQPVRYCATCGKTRLVEWLHRECPPDPDPEDYRYATIEGVTPPRPPTYEDFDLDRGIGPDAYPPILRDATGRPVDVG